MLGWFLHPPACARPLETPAGSTSCHGRSLRPQRVTSSAASCSWPAFDSHPHPPAFPAPTPLPEITSTPPCVVCETLLHPPPSAIESHWSDWKLWSHKQEMSLTPCDPLRPEQQSSDQGWAVLSVRGLSQSDSEQRRLGETGSGPCRTRGRSRGRSRGQA